MKKAYILTSLITCAVMASTHGTTEFFVNTTKGVKKDFKVNEIGIKSEVKVEKTGLSFGGEFKGKGIILPLDKNVDEQGNQKSVIDTFFNNSNIFLKYEIPQMKGINSSVKASLNPKNVELEGDLNYSINENILLGINSKTKFPFEKTVEGNIVLEGDKYKEALMNYGANVKSTHKLYLEAFKNVEAHLALTHSYSQNQHITESKSSELVNKSLKSIEVHAKGTYSKKSLEIKPEFNFKYQFDGKLNTKEYILSDYELLKESIKTYREYIASTYYGEKGHSEKFFVDPSNGTNYKGNSIKKYDELYKDMLEKKKEYSKTKSDENLKKLNYTKQNLETFDNYSKENGKTSVHDPINLENDGYVVSFVLNNRYSLNTTTLNIKPFVTYIGINSLNKNEINGYAHYGLNLDIENTSLIKNVTLKANSTLSSLTKVDIEQNNNYSKHFGLISFGVGAKYDYKVTEKFTLSPTIDNAVNFLIFNEKTLTNLVVEPKLSARYMPNKNLTIEGEISSAVKIGDKLVHTKESDKYTKAFKFGYKGTKIKTALNIKYEW